MKNVERNGHFLTRGAAVVSVATLSLVLLGIAGSAGPRTYGTAKQAADALIKAAAANDIPAIQTIFGPEGKDIMPSDDPVRDKQDLANFTAKAKEKTAISLDPSDPNRATLVVGADDWPLPVPIVKKDGKWRYDTAAGREEILARRIGANELDTINLLRGYVEAQEDYASEKRDGAAIRQYAQKFVSSPGKQDGLAWKNSDGSPGGPAGEAVARALAEGYTKDSNGYNGYHVRILTAQGPSAPLGERSYIYKGMMIGGFAAVAWPAKYGISGIQTFQVNHDGLVYQKDLGPETAAIASKIDRYNPEKGWVITEDEP